jgi:3-oxoacyl-[acyl-carrier protein] reductase
MLMTGGAIALVASAAACVGLASHEAIAAAKAGVIGLVRAAGATYASHGIRVNCVAPGLVRTPLTELLTHGRNLEASLRMHPLGRLGEPADIAGALAFLLAPEHAWITGQVLGVDGGLATLRGRPEA